MFDIITERTDLARRIRHRVLHEVEPEGIIKTWNCKLHWYKLVYAKSNSLKVSVFYYNYSV